MIDQLRRGARHQDERASMARDVMSASAAPAPARTPTIAACVIVRNGAQTIERLIASLRPHVDEICVFLGGESTDGTPAILARLAAEPGAPILVEQGEWHDDYAAARNASFAMASSEYVSWWDDDEILEGGQHVRAILAEHRPDVLDLRRIEAWATETGDIACYFRERFIRSDLGVRWSYRIHEQLEPSIPSAAHRLISVGGLLRVIHHPLTIPNRHKHRALVEAEYARTGSVWIGWYGAKYLAFDDDNDEAAAALLEKLVTPPWDPHEAGPVAHAYQLLAHCRAKLGDLNAAAAALATHRELVRDQLTEPFLAKKEALSQSHIWPIEEDDPVWDYVDDPRTATSHEGRQQ